MEMTKDLATLIVAFIDDLDKNHPGMDGLTKIKRVQEHFEMTHDEAFCCCMAHLAASMTAMADEISKSL